MAKRSNHPRSSRKSPRLSRTKKKEATKGTRDLIDGYSKQFLRVDEDVSFKDNPGFSRQSRKDIFYSSISMENQSSVDCYDFDEQDDDICLRLDLSPIRPVKTPASTRRKRTSRSTGRGNNKRGRSQSANKENKSSNKRRRMDTVKEKNAKNKKATPKSGIQKSSPQDSGVFMTPPSLCELDASVVPTSTPAVTSVHSKLSKNKPKKKQKRKRSEVDSSDGYDLSETPMLSPVQRIVSPASEALGALVVSQSEMFDSMDYGSPKLRTSMIENSAEPDEPYKTLNISRTYSGLGFGSGYFDKPLEKKKKSSKKAKRESVSRYDVIATEMNQEFDDLADFQLSID